MRPAALTLDTERFDVAVTHTVCLAGAFMVADPISGRPLTDRLPAAHVGSPFTLLHGLADDVVPVAASRAFAVSLKEVGWPVELLELAADHGSIARADYDPAADRYEPTTREEALRVAQETAARISTTLGR